LVQPLLTAGIFRSLNAIGRQTNKDAIALGRPVLHNQGSTNTTYQSRTWLRDRTVTSYFGGGCAMFSSTFYPLATLFAEEIPVPPGVMWGLYLLLAFLGIVLLCELVGLRYIPNSRVGIVEKLWSAKGSVEEGRIIALSDEAGYQADLLRGGFHLGFWRW